MGKSVISNLWEFDIGRALKLKRLSDENYWCRIVLLYRVLCYRVFFGFNFILLTGLSLRDLPDTPSYACLDKRDCWHSLSMERGAFWILNRWDIILSYSKKAPHSFDEIMQKGRTHQPHWFNWPCQFNAAKTVLILSFFCRDQLREWGQFHVSNDSTMKVKKYLDRLN